MLFAFVRISVCVPRFTVPEPASDPMDELVRTFICEAWEMSRAALSTTVDFKLLPDGRISVPDDIVVSPV